MDTTEKTIDIINDLIKINNERVAGLETASASLENDDLGLRKIFDKLAGESRVNVAELSCKTQQYNGKPEGGANIYRTLHRAWLDVKSSFTGNDLETILNKCDRAEDAIEEAYNSALKNLKDLPYGVVELIIRQHQGISKGHDLIRSFRHQSGKMAQLETAILFEQ